MTEEAYLGNYYRISANVNLDAICANVQNMKKRLRRGTKLMAVVKADAYGHGAVPVVHALDRLREKEEPIVDAYGVAVLEEAVELRRAGIEKPILILGAILPELVPVAVRYGIRQTVFLASMAERISAEAAKQGKTAKIHIKLDTGMGRLGFFGTHEDALEVRRISKLPGICVEGLFSHFSRADEAKKDFSKMQLEKYMKFCEMLEALGVHPKIRHISGSAGMIDLPEANLDMVRCGISTYGLYPSAEVMQARLPLVPAMELKSRISYIKQVPPGSSISYGGTFVTDRQMRIATVPVGYADGYPRALSGKGRVLIRGKSARILGTICMDQFMADVTDIPEAALGDPVTLVGRDGQEFIPVEEPAGLAGSFHYEFVCGISKRVPRVYFQDGAPVFARTEVLGVFDGMDG